MRTVGTHWNIARALDEMEFHELAGNCLEMALLAARWAEHQDAEGHRYIATVGQGVHAFCVIAQDEVKPLAFPDLDRFVGQRRSGYWIVLDPWLHVTCPADQFRRQAESQLQRWQAKNKRIHLCEGVISEPNGEFRTALIDEPVALKKFEDPGQDFAALMAEVGMVDD